MKRNGHKFNAVRTKIDGHSFASKAEAKRYGELKMLEKAGEIEGLELQPRFPLELQGHKLGTYIADFRYAVTGKGILSRHARVVVEDVKGVRTETYRLKKKIVEAQYGITITEITK